MKFCYGWFKSGNPTPQHLKIKYRTPKQFEVKIKLLKNQKSDWVEITLYICSIHYIIVSLRQAFETQVIQAN